MSVYPPEKKSNYPLWHNRVKDALAWRETHPNGPRRWDKNRRLAGGVHWRVRNESEFAEDQNKKIRVQFTQSTVLDFLAFLLRHSPKFVGKPSGGARNVAIVRRKAALLTWAWRRFRMQKQVRRAVRDGIIVSHGVVRTGWSMDVDPNVQPDQDGSVNLSDAIRQEGAYVRRVKPDRFIFDPEAPDQDVESARWVAEIFFRPWQDVVQDERYSSAARNKLRSGELTPTKATTFRQQREAAGAGGQVQTGFPPVSAAELDAAEPITLFEIWDRRFRRRYVLMDGVESHALVDEPWPFDYLDGFPYVTWSFIEQNDDPWGKGLPESIEDQQLELDVVRSAQFAHVRRFSKRQWQAPQGMAPSEVNKLRDGKDDEVVFYQPGGKIEPIEAPALPTDFDRLEATIKEDFRTLTGSDQMLQGGSLPSRTSATEIRTRASLIGLKIEDKVAAVDDFVLRIGRQVLQHYEANMTRDVLVEVAGDIEGPFQTMSAEDIQAELELELVTVSAEREDETVMRQQAAQAVEMLLRHLPLIAQSGYQVDVGQMVYWLLVEKLGARELDQFITKAPPSPMMAVPPGLVGSMAPGGNSSTAAPSSLPDGQQAAQIDSAPVQSAVLGALASRT